MRLWPASTDERPKQFYPLGSAKTMLQETVARVQAGTSLHRSSSVIIDMVEKSLINLPLSGVTLAAVILDPFGRNTASVAVIAADWAQRHRPKALVLLTPADHVVADAERFRTDVRRGVHTARDHIVTFGIRPSEPETGYGYIQSGEHLGDDIFAVRRFVEKSGREIAETYIAEGYYFWNGAIFLYDPSLLLAEARRFCPGIAIAAVAALAQAAHLDGAILLDPTAFASAPSEPVDIAVMEKTGKAAVMSVAFGWADIGSWSELWRYRVAHEAANYTSGDTPALDTAGSLLWSDGPWISVIGMKDVIVVATRGHVLVLPKSRAQDVKKIVPQLKIET